MKRPNRAHIATMRRYERAGEIGIAALGLIAVAYEMTFDDLLSMATERWCKRHPVLARIPIFAICGHLACVLPHQLDIFSAHNRFHRYLVWLMRRHATAT